MSKFEKMMIKIAKIGAVIISNGLALCVLILISDFYIKGADGEFKLIPVFNYKMYADMGLLVEYIYQTDELTIATKYLDIVMKTALLFCPPAILAIRLNPKQNRKTKALLYTDLIISAALIAFLRIMLNNSPGAIIYEYTLKTTFTPIINWIIYIIICLCLFYFYIGIKEARASVQ